MDEGSEDYGRQKIACPFCGKVVTRDEFESAHDCKDPNFGDRKEKTDEEDH